MTALSRELRERYARQLLLVEVGASGQERLLSSEALAPGGMSNDALGYFSEYATRAGLRIIGESPRVSDGDGDGGSVSLSARDWLQGRHELQAALDLFDGALAATKVIRDVVLPTSKES